MLIGKPEEKRLLARPRRGWENNIKGFNEIGCKGVNCIHVARDGVQGLVVNTIMNHRVRWKPANFSNVWATISITWE